MSDQIHILIDAQIKQESINQMKKQLKQVEREIGSNVKTGGFSQLNKTIQAGVSVNKQWVDSHANMGNIGKKIASELKLPADSIKSLNVNTKDSINGVVQFSAKINDGSKHVKTYSGSFDTLNQKITLTKAGIQELSVANNFLQRTLEGAFKFMRFYIVGQVLVTFISELKNSVKVIKEVDASLTQLRKVSGESLETMAKFAIVANESAKNLGATTIEVINATVEFSRLGYAIKEASKLAEESILLSLVGNMSVERASTALISTIKAFGIEVDVQGNNVRRVIDMINEVGNNFAISQEGIAEILQRSSSAMVEAGNTIEQTIALGTGAQEIVQSAEKVGTALRTMSMRIRGVSDEGEDLTDLVPTMEKQFNTIGLSLKKDNETFKSTYEIMEDLSKVWHTLTDIQRADILESIAGKRQGQIAAAMISNFKNIEKSLLAAQNSIGSAEAEFIRAMDSIAYKTNKLKETMSELWIKTINREGVKAFIDVLTVVASALVFIVEKFGLLNTAIVIVTTSLLLLSKGFLTFYSTNIASMFLGLGNAVLALATKLGIATGAATVLGTAITMIAPIAIVTGIVLLVSHINKLNKSMSDLRNEVEESYNKSQLNINQLKQWQEEYKNLADKVDLTREEKLKLIDIERQLKTRFGETVEAIDLQNGSLTDNIELIDLLMKKEAERFQILNERAYKEAKRLLEDKTEYKINVAGKYDIVFKDITDAIVYMEELVRNAVDKGNLVYDKRVEKLKELYDEYDSATDIISKYESYESLLEEQQKTKPEPKPSPKAEQVKKDTEAFEEAYNYNKYLQDLELRDTEEYYKKLKELYNKYWQSLDVDRRRDIVLELHNLQKELNIKEDKELPYTATIDALYEYQKALDDVTLALERNKILTDLAEKDNDKIRLLSERIELLKQEQQALNNINEARRKLIQQDISKLRSAGFDISYDSSGNQLMINNMERLKAFTGDAAKQYEKLIDNILDLNKTNQDASNQWWTVRSEIEKTKDSMSAVNDEIANTLRKQADLIKQQNQEKLSAIKETEDKIIQIIKKRYELERKEAEDTYKKDIKLLDDRLDKFRDYINEQLGLLDDQFEEEDYQREVNDKNKEILDLEKELNKLSLDDSLETRKKKLEIQEQIDQKKLDLDKFMENHSRDIQKDNLKKMLDDYEDNINDKKDKREEEYKDFLDDLEERSSDVKIYLEVQEAMLTGVIKGINGEIVSIQDAYITFEDRFGQGMSILGNKIKNEFIANLRLAQDAIKDLGALEGGKTSDKGNNPFGMSRGDFAEYKENKRLWTEEFTNTGIKRDDLRALNEILRKKYGIDSDTYSYEDLKGYYSSGGLANYTGIAAVHGSDDRPEVFLNNKQAAGLFNFIKDIPKNYLNFSKPSIPNLAGIPNGNISLAINVAGDATPSTVNQIKIAGLDIIKKVQEDTKFMRNGIRKKI